MAHNYTHGPSMSDHIVPPTTILNKVGPFEQAKSHDFQSHLIRWVLFVVDKHNPLAQTYKLKVDILLHKLWHTKFWC